jgi:CRP-like cAMP-binding protein
MLNRRFFSRDDFPAAKEITMRKGSFLLMEGDQATQGAYLLLEGLVDVFIEGLDGQEILLFQLGPGHVLGEMGIIGGFQRMSFVRCLTTCKLLHISRQSWLECMKSERFVRKLLDSVVARYSETQKVVNRLGQSKVTLRLGAWLMDHPDWERPDNPGYIDIRLPTHINLARMINCTRERITRILNELVSAGAIEFIDESKTARIHEDRLMNILQNC